MSSDSQATTGQTAAGTTPWPLDQAQRMAEVSGRIQQLMLDHVAKQSAQLPPDNPFASLTDMWAGWARMAAAMNPAELVRIQTEYLQDSVKLWTAMLTGNAAEAPAATNRKDRRFAHGAWSEQPVFDMLKRSYLLASHHITEAVGRMQGLTEEEKQRAEFSAKQFVEAMSPANFAALNPAVIEEAQRTQGESLVKGLEHMLADLRRGQLTLTDETAFEVGRNVAVTPGKVVYENRLFQLIQYSPTTETVFAEPLVIFPPWINKFYILDLTPEKSFIRWAVEQGLTVFVVSWRNADESLADVVLDNYVLEGMVTALSTVRAITGAQKAHAIGYCVAGTTLAIALSYLTSKEQADQVATATYFTAQTDFADAGDLLNFIDDKKLQGIEELSKSKGYLDGRYLAAVFNMLRPTDLIWNYVVNNYLLGKDYAPFDLLFWNSDATNVPARWHHEYLRDCYHDNRLATPGGIQVAGVPIDTRQVTVPTYIQAGRDDHIAPLKSVWKLTKAFGGPVRFMLAGSGHIAGVVNPPSAKKYQHWVLGDDVPLPDTLEEFQRQATEFPGSWWPDWIRFIAAHSSPDKVPARVPGSNPDYPAIEDAPGRYVKQKIA